MTRRPRPLTDDERHDLAVTLRQLADTLTTPDAARTQRLLADTIDDTHPRRHGTTDTPGSLSHIGHGTSTTEAAAIHGRTQPATQHATRLIQDTRDLYHLAGVVRAGLQALRPDRTVECCPNGHPLERGRVRCQVIDPDDGTQCGARPNTRHCGNPNCGRELRHGEPLRNGRCAACDMHWRRKGRDRITADGLALRDELLTEGTYVA